MSPAAAAALDGARGAAAPPFFHSRVRRAGARRRLAILHLITRLDRGGSSDCTLLQAMAAARRGHAVTIACGPGDEATPLLAAARSTPGIGFETIAALRRPVRPWSDLKALFAIARLYGRRFDIVHTHTSKAGALGRLARLLRPVGALVHQPHGHLFYGYFGSAGTSLVVLAERLLAPLADAQIVLSRRGAEEHLDRGIGRPGAFTVVRSGIDLRPIRAARRRRAEARARLALAPGDLVVGSLGRLEPIKGVADLVEAFLLACRDRPTLRLLLAGDGALLEALRRRASAAPPGRIAITGRWMPPEEVLPALDIFALPSRNEGMGRSLVEAMACGVPVVASAVGGVAEVLEEGACGLLVPPGDPASLARAIGRLVDDGALAARLAARGRARAPAFGAGRMARGLLKLYDEVAA